MDSKRLKQIEEIYHAVLDTAPDDRESFLGEHCDGDQELRSEVESLLSFENTPDNFIDESPGPLAAEMFTKKVAGLSLANETIDHYTIQELIGLGGMGEVYLANDVRLNRKVALKILHDDIASDAHRLKRFEQEAQAASALNHPNILTVHEFGTSGGIHYLATEYIDGETLRQAINSGELTLMDTLTIAEQAAFALSSAHTAGIVHRDIKPDNVMIRKDGIVKLLDFGLAKLSEPVVLPKRSFGDLSLKRFQTHSGLIMGTPNYMSPEQARGEKTDHQTDIFSLGVVLYEMLSGNLPFLGESVTDIITEVLKKEPKPLDRVTPELEAIVKKCLQKEKRKRYHTAKSLLRDLKEAKQELEIKIRLEHSSKPPRDKKKNGSRKVSTTETKTLITNRVDLGVAGNTTKDSPDTPTLMISTSDLTKESFSSVNISRPSLRRERILFASLLIALAAGGFFGYRYFTANARIRSIAVLPFANVTGNADNEYLSDGLSDSLINKLSQLAQLKVIAHSSTFKYKGKEIDTAEIAKALDVQALLTGQIAQLGDNLQISVELINAMDNTRIWGESYNRKVTAAQSVSDEIAQTVSGKLQINLSGAQEQQLAKRLTNNPQAYQSHLNGVFFRRKNGSENIRKAIEYQTQAIALDPNFTLAYIELAINYGNLVDIGSISPKDGLPLAKAAAEKALALDDTLADAYYNIARIRKFEFDWTQAEIAFKRALEINPNLAGAHTIYAEYLSQMGRFDEALREIKLAQELDPLRNGLVGNEGSILYFARRYDEAIVKKQIHASSAPENPFAHLELANAYVQKEQYAAAILAYQASIKIEETTSALIYLGRAYALTGQRDEAVAILDKLNKTEKYVSPAELAILCAALGDNEAAIALLEKAYAEGDTQLTSLKVDPGYDPLRNDAHFQDLLQRVGLAL